MFPTDGVQQNVTLDKSRVAVKVTVVEKVTPGAIGAATLSCDQMILRGCLPLATAGLIIKAMARRIIRVMLRPTL
jgi:hypothetical protein